MAKREYEVMVQQTVVRIFTKRFKANSIQNAEDLAQDDVDEGLDDTWTEDTNGGGVQGETVTGASVVVKKKVRK